MSGVMARLDWSMGCRVMCGVIDCGADIASVVVVQIAPYPSSYEPRVACFAPGWQRRHDGIWELSRHAKANLQRYRRRPPRPKKEHFPYPKPLLSRRPTGLGKESQSLRHALKRPQLPARAKCPACGFINVLEAARLYSIDPRSPLPECAIVEPDRWVTWELERIEEDESVDPLVPGGLH